MKLMLVIVMMIMMVMMKMSDSGGGGSYLQTVPTVDKNGQTIRLNDVGSQLVRFPNWLQSQWVGEPD